MSWVDYRYAPDSIAAPLVAGAQHFFLSDGSTATGYGPTTAGALYYKPVAPGPIVLATAEVTLAYLVANYVAQTRQLLTPTGSALSGGGNWSADRSIAVVVDGVTIEISTNTLQLKDKGVAYAKFPDQGQATFLMRAAAAGTGAPIAGTAAQAKTALAILPGDVAGFDTQVRLSRLDQMAAPTASVSLGSQKIISLADGTTTNDAVNFGQMNTAIAAAVVGLLDYRGTYNASTNLFPAAGGSGIAGAVLKGDFWICSVQGTLGGVVVRPGDLIIALVDTPAQTASNWDLVEHDLGYAPEDVANKSTDGTMAANSAVLYPSQSAVRTYAQPLDATLTALAGQNYALDTVAVGTGADTVAQVTVGANQFLAKGASGAYVAKTITTLALTFLAATTSAAWTALLDVATTTLKGLLSSADKTKLDYLPNLVTDYGADPTGTTDIAAAVTAAVAAGVAQVFVPKGVYKCATAGTHVIASHLLFVGAGRKDTIFKTNHATANGFQWRDWGGGFVDCGFDTFVARTAGNCVDLPNATQAGAGSGSKYAQIRRCDFYNQFVAIRTGDHEQHFDDIEVRWPGLSLSGQGGIIVDGDATANDKRFSDLLMQGNDSAGQFGVRIIQAASVTFGGRNDLIDCGNALDIIPGNGQSVPSIYAINTFFDNSQIGVNIAPTGTGAVLRCHFTQCWFSSNATAGMRLNSANIAGIDLVNCDIFGNAIGIEAINAQHWGVSFSRLAGNTTAAIRATAVSTHNFDVTANRFGTIASPQFGVNAIGVDILVGTYNKYYVTGNTGLETDTIPIQDLGVVGPTGTKLVSDNPGLLLRGASLPPLSSGGAALLATAGRGAVTSGVGETFLATWRIPGRAVGPGQTFRLRAFSVTSAGGVPTWGVKAGTAGTTGDTTNLAVVQVAQAANVRQVFEAYVQVVSIGASGTVVINGDVMGGTTSAGIWVNETVAAEAVLTFSTNGAWFITLTCACATTGTVTIQQMTLEAL